MADWNVIIYVKSYLLTEISRLFKNCDMLLVLNDISIRLCIDVRFSDFQRQSFSVSHLPSFHLHAFCLEPCAFGLFIQLRLLDYISDLKIE